MVSKVVATFKYPNTPREAKTDARTMRIPPKPKVNLVSS